MHTVKYRVTALVCTLVFLLVAGEAPAKHTNSESKTSEQSQSRKSRKENAAVTVWFKEYDQIRRNAEMTSKDKYQAFFIGKNEPDKKNAKLASQMLDKYAGAAAAMKQLQSTPETSKLQEGYTQYFTSARQLFADYLEAQKVVPFSNKALVKAKKSLEVLDKTNKRIDTRLRKQFWIPKHKHI